MEPDSSSLPPRTSPGTPADLPEADQSPTSPPTHESAELAMNDHCDGMPCPANSNSEPQSDQTNSQVGAATDHVMTEAKSENACVENANVIVLPDSTSSKQPAASAVQKSPRGAKKGTATTTGSASNGNTLASSYPNLCALLSPKQQQQPEYTPLTPLELPGQQQQQQQQQQSLLASLTAAATLQQMSAFRPLFAPGFSGQGTSQSAFPHLSQLLMPQYGMSLLNESSAGAKYFENLALLAHQANAMAAADKAALMGYHQMLAQSQQQLLSPRSNSGPNPVVAPVSTKLTSPRSRVSKPSLPQPPPQRADETNLLVEAVKAHMIPLHADGPNGPNNGSAGYGSSGSMFSPKSEPGADDFSLEKCLQAAQVHPSPALPRRDLYRYQSEQFTFDGTTVLCQVCGDKASGFHYGVHACEGCKGFFRRSIQQKIQYRPCSKNQQCSVLRINRNRCQYCRLKKCIAVGMSREAVRFGRVPKQEKAKMVAEMQKAAAQSQVSCMAAELEDEDKLIKATIAAHFATCEFTKEHTLPQLQLIKNRQPLTHMACPLNPNAPNINGRASNGSQQAWEDFSERYSPAIRGVVDFAKAIPGFHLLSQEDQVTLLKAGVFEVLLLRLSVLFDIDSKTLTLLDGSVYRRDATPPAGYNSMQGRFLIDSLFDFVDRFNCLCLNDADIALFCAVVLISPDRPGLRNFEMVERMNLTLQQALKKMLLRNHGNDPTLFPQLMQKIPDLRTVNTLHSEKLLAFKMDPQQQDQKGRHMNDSSSSAASDTSSHPRSPLSDSSVSDATTDSNANKKTTASEWSILCKASEAETSSGSSSASDSAPESPISGGSAASGKAEGICSDLSSCSSEAAQINALNLSGLTKIANGSLQIGKNGASGLLQAKYPKKECGSFDSGKGTLSCEASSGESLETLSDQHHSDNEVNAIIGTPSPSMRAKSSESLLVSKNICPAGGSNPADMPNLKKALQAPPIAHFNHSLGTGLPTISTSPSSRGRKPGQASLVLNGNSNGTDPFAFSANSHLTLQNSAAANNGTELRQKHLAVASLLEKPPSNSFLLDSLSHQMSLAQSFGNAARSTYLSQAGNGHSANQLSHVINEAPPRSSFEPPHWSNQSQSLLDAPASLQADLQSMFARRNSCIPTLLSPLMLPAPNNRRSSETLSQPSLKQLPAMPQPLRSVIAPTTIIQHQASAFEPPTNHSMQLNGRSNFTSGFSPPKQEQRQFNGGANGGLTPPNGVLNGRGYQSPGRMGSSVNAQVNLMPAHVNSASGVNLLSHQLSINAGGGSRQSPKRPYDYSMSTGDCNEQPLNLSKKPSPSSDGSLQRRGNLLQPQLATRM